MDHIHLLHSDTFEILYNVYKILRYYEGKLLHKKRNQK